MRSLELDVPELSHQPIGGWVNLAKIYDSYTGSGKDDTYSPRILFAHDILSPLGDFPERRNAERNIGDQFNHLPPRHCDSRSIAHITGITLMNELDAGQLTADGTRDLEGLLQLQVERLAMKRNAFIPREKTVNRNNPQQQQPPKPAPPPEQFGFFEHQKARHAGASKHAVRSMDEIIEHLRRYHKIAKRRQGRSVEKAVEEKITPKLSNLEKKTIKEKQRIQRETEARLVAIEKEKLQKLEDLEKTTKVAEHHLSDEVQNETARLERLIEIGRPPPDLNNSKLYQGLFLVSKTPGYILTVATNMLTLTGECVTVAGIAIYRLIRFLLSGFK